MKRFQIQQILSLGLMFTVFSCGNSGSSITGSCNLESVSVCQDYTSSFGDGAEAHCIEKAGAYANTACTTEGRVGSCAISSGEDADTIIRYFSTTEEIASATCTTLTGTYTSGMSAL